MICITCGKEIVGDSSICLCCGCLTGDGQLPAPVKLRNVDKRNPLSTSYNPLGTPNKPYFNNSQNTNFINQTPTTPDKVNPWLVILTLIFPVIGLIIGVSDQNHGKKKSGKVYTLIATINLGLLFILGAIGAVILVYFWYRLMTRQ